MCIIRKFYPLFLHFFSTLWILFLCLAICGSAYLSGKSLYRYNYFPTVNSIDKDYKNWNTTLPALLVCPKNRLDQRKLKAFLTRQGRVKKIGMQLDFKKQSKRRINCNRNIICCTYVLFLTIDFQKKKGRQGKNSYKN